MRAEAAISDRCWPGRYRRQARRRRRAVSVAGSGNDEVAKLLEPSGPDPWNGVELVPGAERARLFAVVEDLLRRHRADTRERVELLERGRAQLDRHARRCSAA